MIRSETAQKIKTMPQTPIKVTMGGLTTPVIVNEEAKSKGDIEIMYTKLDFSSELNKQLYRAMFPEVNTFLEIYTSTIAQEAMNVTDSFQLDAKSSLDLKLDTSENLADR
jgi:hypothetical protein